jgi:enoyl-CoA hydratase
VSDPGTMIAHTDGLVARMVFSNQARRNALTVDMWRAIPKVLESFEQNPAVRVIVLSGAGDTAFAAGADISQFETERSTADAVQTYEALTKAAFDCFKRLTKPTIAQIRGYCIGGGLGVALACDLRIAADDARFAIPAARLGLGYEYTGVKKLADLVGPAFAKEIFFTGRQFDATEALAMGLVNRVVRAGDLQTMVATLAQSIAVNAPLSITAAKLAIDAVNLPEGEQDLARVRMAVESCFRSRDYVEGRSAFLEKRKADFRGS